MSRIELIPIEREWELVRERELKNVSDTHLLLQRVIDDMKKDGKYSDEDVKLAKERLLKDYEAERVRTMASTAPPPHIIPGLSTSLNASMYKAYNKDIRNIASTTIASSSAPVIETSSAKIAQLPDLTSTLLTTAFNLITGFIFAIHAIFMQWGILFLAGQMVMIEFNDMLREDIEELLDGETPDLSSPGIIAIILWALETLVALTLTLVVHEQKSDKSWVSWAWYVGSWAVAPFFVVDGIAVITVIVFLTGNMDTQNVWFARVFYSLTSIGGYVGSQRAIGVMGANMPMIKAYGKSISSKFATMSARVSATVGGPWRDTLPAASTAVPVSSQPRVVAEDMLAEDSSDEEAHYE